MCERISAGLHEATDDKHLRLLWHVLTSDSTFSGGEQLAYDLQALGRAHVVGETTRGGAHPSQLVSLGDHIELRLPVALERKTEALIRASSIAGAGYGHLSPTA